LLEIRGRGGRPQPITRQVNDSPALPPALEAECKTARSRLAFYVAKAKFDDVKKKAKELK
jgi:hypothetical protein